MNKEFNLDDFKADFQKSSPHRKDAQSIRKMLNKSSMNNVKYLIYISVAEFLILVILFVIECSFSLRSDDNLELISLSNNSMELISNITFVFRLLYGFFLLISFSFIITFYQIYKHLSLDQSIKDFTDDIISFRQKANYFIAYNVAVFIFFWFFITIFMVHFVKSVANENHIMMQNNYEVYIYAASFVIFLIAMIIIFVYYRFFWGLFLQRLKRNQQELEEMNKNKRHL